MDFVRRPEAQAFARLAVELIVRLLHALLAHARQRLALREVLPQETVGILVCAALPRAVGQREVEFHADLVGAVNSFVHFWLAVGTATP